MKQKIKIALCIFTISTFFMPIHVSASKEEINLENQNNNFITVDKEGNFKEISMDKLESLTIEENSQKWNAMLRNGGSIGGTKNITNGVVNFKTKGSSSLNTNYTIADTSQTGYTNGYYGADGAFLGYSNDGTKVKFMQAGVIGWVNASEVEVLDYDDNNAVKSVNFYRCENGRIYHYGTNNLKSSYYWLVNDIGPQQSYMKSNKVYYSYDGHYFYETYAQMISDYKNDTRSHAINPTSPYYNYYQFLSHRTKTNFTANDFDAYLSTKTSSVTSKMKGLGKSFIDYQNTYGANAVLMYGVAINESGYGNSTIAQNKNNLFGHGAVDSNPYYGANGYSTPANSVLYHAKVFISEGYLDACDGSNTNGNGFNTSICLRGRYFGAHLGDKNSGINVKYASDPYWGEKAARVGWELEKYKNNSKVDYGKTTIAIKNGVFNLNIRKSASSSSTLLYQSPKNSHIPFVIIGETTGQNVNGSTKWYKIQTDSVLDSTGNKLIQDSGAYNFSTNVGYIHSSYVDIIYHNGDNGNDNSDNNNNDNNSGNNDNQGNEDKPSVIRGDVNNDKKVTSIDYLMIKDSIMGKINLSSAQKNAADVNNDAKVSAPDYLMIKDFIMGKIKL